MRKICSLAVIQLTLSLVAFGQTRTADTDVAETRQESQAMGREAGNLAEDVIRILRENPTLLVEARTQISNELSRRGIPVTDSELTDIRIFSQIRNNSILRETIADNLRSRGFQIGGSRGQEARKVDADDEPPPSDPLPTPVDIQGAEKAREKDKGSFPSTPQLRSRPNPYKDMPALIDLYRQFRTGEQVPRRFGEDFFQIQPSRAGSISAMDMPLGSDYVLGPGDGISLDIHGSYTQRSMQTVNHEGRISLPEVGSVLVAGLTIAAAEIEVRKALQTQFREVNVDLSVNRLRRVRVYIVGDVKRPGAYEASSLSTVLSALLSAGGPTDVGSYRSVRLSRNGKLIRQVDLYDLLLRGLQPKEEGLQSGDTILVPPAGPQVTIAGVVRRPGIYELKEERSIADVLALSGGVLVAGELNNIKVERVEAHVRREMVNLNLDPRQPIESQPQTSAFMMRDGDLVTVSPILPYSDQVVYLQGHVFRPGRYPFRRGMTVLDLVAGYEELLPEPADRAELIRLRPPDFRPNIQGLDLRGMLDKRVPAVILEPFDTVRIQGRYENDPPAVSIYGEVVRAGEYPLSDGMSAADLVRMAGGFKRSAYVKSADLSSYEVDGDKVVLQHREVAIGRAVSGESENDVPLQPGDVLTIRQLGQWSEIGGSIVVQGAVLYPGRYGVQQGERLSAILQRAGGFSPDAYPAGAVLDRVQVREIANKSKEQLIQRLESEGTDSSLVEVRAAAQQQRQHLIERLKSAPASGRLVIRISRTIDEWRNTPSDIEIRPGDSLFIPKKPDFVLVSGQVYSPSAISFEPGRTAGWYLKQAGGPTGFASRKDTFVIRSNGSVIGRESSGFWGGGVLATRLEPGDTIVVPEKIVSGSAFWRDLAQSAQVISAIAIAARVATSF